MRITYTPKARVDDVVRRCSGQQDEAAWGEFNAWFGQVAASVLRRFGNLTPVEREEAEDAARVAMALAISAGRVAAGEEGTVAGYARAVIANAARDVWRRRRPSEPLPASLQDAAPTAAVRVGLRDELTRVGAAIESWSTEDRFIFALKVDGVPTATIRQELERRFRCHLSAQAIDVRVHRLRGRLRGNAEDPGTRSGRAVEPRAREE